MLVIAIAVALWNAIATEEVIRRDEWARNFSFTIAAASALQILLW